MKKHLLTVLFAATTATALAQITDTGNNVGIGNATPTSKLDVNGSINLSVGNRVTMGGVNLLNSIGTRNIHIGDAAGSVSTGTDNAFIGFQAGRLNTTGVNNAFIGRQAGAVNTTGSNSVIIGNRAGFANTTGFDNAMLGFQAGLSNTIGSGNNFFGKWAGRLNTTGGNNSFFGTQAGQSNTTGSSNTYVGYLADGSATLTNATAIGANATVAQSNSVVLGNNANVGIGTSAPAQKLHVTGSARITGAILDSNNDPGTAGQVLSSTVTGTDWVMATAGPMGPTGPTGAQGTQGPAGADGATGATGPLEAGSNGQTLRHNGTQWVASPILYNNGTNIGIGTEIPNAKLQVVGTVNMTGFRMTTNASSGKLLGSMDAAGNAQWIDPVMVCDACESQIQALVDQSIEAQSIFIQNGSSVGTDPDFFQSNFLFGSSIMNDPANPASNEATRMFLDKTSAIGAFRAGTSNNGAWNSRGENSFATGLNTEASGANSFAAGIRGIANQSGSIALGQDALASGPNSLAMGINVTASANSAMAMGANALAAQPYSMAGGYNSSANAMYAMAFHGGTADGEHALALGGVALGARSFSLYGTANGDSALAMGVGSVSDGIRSSALGYNSRALGDYSNSFGYNSEANGLGSLAMGVNSTASGTSAMAIGNASSATGIQAFSMGNNAVASGDRSFALGTNVKARSSWEVIVGQFEADTTFNHAKNWNAADRLFSVANGANSSSRSDAFVVRKNGRAGIGSATTDAQLHVSGLDGLLVTGTLGSGENVDSSVIVDGTKMFFYPKRGAFRAGQVTGTQWNHSRIGLHSFAVGYNTVASGHRSVAMGHDVIAPSNNEVAIGIWNTEYTPAGNTTDRAFSIGIGTGSGANRKNAMTVLKNGSVGIGTDAPASLLEVVGDAIINSHTVGRGGANSSTNLALGMGALSANISTGLHNVAIGRQALVRNTSGDFNNGLGYDALANNNTGNRNVAMGYQALGMNASGTQLTSNVAIGYQAGGTMTTGYGNVLMGEEAGEGITTGYDNTWVGKQIGNSGSLAYFNSTAIGNGTPVDANNKARIGNGSVTSIGGQVGWTNFSDARIKDNVKNNVVGLEFIKALRPVTYNFNVDRQNSLLGMKPEDSEGKYAIQDITFSGFLAQEVDEAAKAVEYDFSGVDRSGTLLGLRYAEFTVPLVKAVQELSEMVEELKPANLDSLEALVTAQRQELDAQHKVNAEQQRELAAQQVQIEALNFRNAIVESQLQEILSRLNAFDTDLQQCCFDFQGQSIDHSPQSIVANAPKLEQNIPNPFHENTTIKYYLPNGMRTASIVITDLSGVPLKNFDLGGTKGFGQVLISGGAFAAGTYIYTLTVDGKVVDSKRMVLL